MKKVVRIIGRMNGGGPARQVAHLHQALRGTFDTVLVVGRVEEGEQDMRYLLRDSSGVHEVPSMSRSIKGFSELASLIRIVRLLQREKPDIVHTHTSKAGVLGRMAAIVTRVPVRVHTYHGHVFHGYFGATATKLILTIERTLNRFTTRVIAISPSQADDLAGKFRVAKREQIAVVRTGFDLAALGDADRFRSKARRDLGVSDDEVLVVWAGRLVEIKNIPLLLEVVRLARRTPRIKFLVVGEGLHWPAVEAAAGSCENLQVLKWQVDMKPIIAAADVMLLTSRNEGTPALLIEAMAAGKPFVATAVGGVVDLAVPPLETIEDGCRMASNGFITTASGESIARCLERVAASPDLAAQMGKAGKNFVMANHDQQRLVDEMTNLYRELLTAEAAGARTATLAALPEETRGH
jgi:glycosyltransferase involved in cell wall biosynthesis